MDYRAVDDVHRTIHIVNYGPGSWAII